MAKQTARSSEPKHTEAGPDVAPHGREKMMEEYRVRRKGEPAAAAMETDAESGGASAVAGLPGGAAPRDPAKPYLEKPNAGDTAGSPQPEADVPAESRWFKWVIGALIVVAVIYAVFQI